MNPLFDFRRNRFFPKGLGFWFFLLPSLGFGQSEFFSLNQFLVFSADFGFYEARDEYYSPLRYRGWGFGGGLGFEDNKKEKFDKSEISFFAGSLNNGAPYANRLSLNSIAYDAVNYYSNSTSGVWSNFIGFTIKLNFSNRGNERNTAFEGLNTLGLVFALNNSKWQDDRWMLNGYAHLPLIGWGIRPRYTAPTYEKKGPHFYKPSHLFLFFPKMLALEWQTSATQFLKNGNGLRYAYHWQFYRLSQVQKVSVLKQNLRFSALMGL